MFEKLARDLVMSLDGVSAMRQCGMEPDPWQARFLRSQARRILLCCSRQSGKSTTTGYKAVWHAITRRDALVLIVSRSDRQSGLLFQKVMRAYRDLGRPVRSLKETERMLFLANGSQIWSLPGSIDTLVGFSGVTLLILDEASRVPDNVYRELVPMLAVSQGQLIGLSTPFGRRGWFFEEWRGYDEQPRYELNSQEWWQWRVTNPAGWQRYRVTATECPRIPPEFLEEERSKSEWWYLQNYCCHFLDVMDQFFSLEIVEAAMRDDVDPLFAQPSPAAVDETSILTGSGALLPEGEY